MSTTGQFSSKNPTIKRILKEASELNTQPSPDYHAAPLETDLFEWHFTLRGAPAPSPFADGIYHGRIVLPPAYPLKPPSFRFLTPTGRFEVNREICLSISGHHEETWQPAWGIRTALVAIRSFMDTDAKGQLGGMDASAEVRQRFAASSRSWKCPSCGKANENIMREQEEAVQEAGGEKKEDVVPDQLRLAYREDLGGAEAGAEQSKSGEVQSQSSQATADTTNAQSSQENISTVINQTPAATVPVQSNVQSDAQIPQQPQRQIAPPRDDIPPWIDKAIYGIIAALVVLLWKKLAGGI